VPSSPGADAEIAAAIEAAGGAISFERFMELALYGEHGFYRAGGVAGRRGDFITSAEVGPLFGAVLARAIDGWWHELGRPDDFTVIEAGAGRGTLARSILAAAPLALGNGPGTSSRVELDPVDSGRVESRPGSGVSSTRYHAVEISAPQRAQHPASVRSLAAMPDGPINGVVVANELLDNLPFGLLVFDGGWREAAVVVDRDGALREVLVEPAGPLPPRLPNRAPQGARVPVQRQAARWVQDALHRLRPGGRVVVFDYCTSRTAELAVTPWRSWLRTYAGHERGVHYLAAPGTQDITAQVVVDQLPPPDAVRTQAQFLARWGIDGLVDEGRRTWAAAAAAPDLAAMRMRSRVREAEALLDPHGLGGFLVLEYVREE
jgi:SAM-dependent MidA family methyltransferase